MNLKFQNKKITGILTVLPEKEIKFEDEIDNYEFTHRQSMKLKLVMGFNKRRVVVKRHYDIRFVHIWPELFV